MFGNDFTSFKNKEKTESKNNAKQVSNENPIDQNNYEIGKNINSEKEIIESNYTFMVTLYPDSKDFTFKFLNQFQNVKESGSYSYITTTGVYPVSFLGSYNNEQICISLWIRTTSRSSIIEPVWTKNAYAVLFYFDPKDPKYDLKLIDLINEIKSSTKAKFILIIDKNTMNSELKIKIKSLQDENLIHGIYQFSQDETDNNNRFVNSLFDFGAFPKI